MGFKHKLSHATVRSKIIARLHAIITGVSKKPSVNVLIPRRSKPFGIIV